MVGRVVQPVKFAIGGALAVFRRWAEYFKKASTSQKLREISSKLSTQLKSSREFPSKISNHLKSSDVTILIARALLLVCIIGLGFGVWIRFRSPKATMDIANTVSSVILHAKLVSILPDGVEIEVNFRDAALKDPTERAKGFEMTFFLVREEGHGFRVLCSGKLRFSLEAGANSTKTRIPCDKASEVERVTLFRSPKK